MSKPIVAIVGRPNVGKSTLFNRIAKRRVAIVEDIPGITRDRLYFDVQWLDRLFTLVDTGGFDVAAADKIGQQVRQQAQLAMAEADVIVFLVDAKVGLTQEDASVARLLRETRKPVLLAVNKVDSAKDEAALYEFYNLGLGEPIAVSAANALNIGDLLDLVVARLPQTVAEQETAETGVAVIGRPNVGKSSLVNAILGAARVIVSDVPGTTRDAIDTPLEKDGRRYRFIDTAGIRRKARINAAVEHYSVMRALRAVDRADVVLLVIDAQEGVTEQDKKIAGYAHEAGKGAIIIINKWDLISKDTHTAAAFTRQVRQELAFMPYAPLLFVSALTGQRVTRITGLIDQVAEQRARRVPTSVLNQVVQDAVAITPPPTDRGRRVKIFYATQTGIKPPTFVFYVNSPEALHFSYLRFLENTLREAFAFQGTPVTLLVRGRGERSQQDG